MREVALHRFRIEGRIHIVDGVRIVDEDALLARRLRLLRRRQFVAGNGGAVIVGGLDNGTKGVGGTQNDTHN